MAYSVHFSCSWHCTWKKKNKQTTKRKLRKTWDRGQCWKNKSLKIILLKINELITTFGVSWRWSTISAQLQSCQFNAWAMFNTNFLRILRGSPKISSLIHCLEMSCLSLENLGFGTHFPTWNRYILGKTESLESLIAQRFYKKSSWSPNLPIQHHSRIINTALTGYWLHYDLV